MIDVSALQILYYTIFILIGTITLTSLIMKTLQNRKKTKQYTDKQKLRYWKKKVRRKKTPPDKRKYAKEQIRKLEKKQKK